MAQANRVPIMGASFSHALSLDPHIAEEISWLRSIGVDLIKELSRATPAQSQARAAQVAAAANWVEKMLGGRRDAVWQAVFDFYMSAYLLRFPENHDRSCRRSYIDSFRQAAKALPE